MINFHMIGHRFALLFVMLRLLLLQVFLHSKITDCLVLLLWTLFQNPDPEYLCRVIVEQE